MTIPTLTGYSDDSSIVRPRDMMLFDNGGTPTVASASTPLPMSVSGSTSGKMSAASITRPNNTTAYTANDVIGASTSTTAAITFAAIGTASGNFMITDLNLRINVSAVPSGMSYFRLHLYNTLPASAYVDNAAWDLPAGDTGYQGYIDIDVPTDMGSALYAQMAQVNKVVGLDASGNLYGYLVTIGGYTPTAQAVKSLRLFGTAL